MGGMRYANGVVAMAVAMGAIGTAAATERQGEIRFTGAIVERGFSLQPEVAAVASKSEALPAGSAASGRQVVVKFSTRAMHPVPAAVSVEVRTPTSPVWHRVTSLRGDPALHLDYVGFHADLLTGASGSLSLTRPPMAEPALAIVTVAYR